MRLGRRPHAHLMLAVLAIKGVIHEVGVGQDLGLVKVDMIAVVQAFLFLDVVGHDCYSCLGNARDVTIEAKRSQENEGKGNG